MNARAFPLLGIIAGLFLVQSPTDAGVFQTDFEAGAPDGTRTGGSASADSAGGINNGGVMKLTRAENTAETGAWVIDDFDGGALIGSFTATFKVLIGSPNATPAFGLSFCFGPDVPDSFGVDGAGSGLRVVFDTFDRGGGTAPAIDVYFGGTRLATRRVPVSILRTGTSFAECVIAVQPDGTLDLTYAGQPIYSNLFCYTPISGLWGFGASTGGIADNHWLDDVKIETRPLTAPFVRSVLPGPNGVRPDPTVVVQLEDFGTQINPASIQGALNGNAATPVISKADTITTVRFDSPNPLAAGTTNTARVAFADTGSPAVSTVLEFDFVVANYPTVPAAFAVEPGVVSTATSGFKVRVRQADGALAATLDRAERQLADQLINPATGQPYPNIADMTGVGADGTFSEEDVVNYDDQPHFTGYFDSDKPVPGIPDPSTGSLDNFAVEIITYLDLPAGVHTLGVRSDDGFRLAIGNSPQDLFALELGVAPAGPGTVERVFAVAQPGIYPVRLVWWDAQGDGYLEFYSVSRTGDRTLINDRAQTPALRAYREASATRPYLQSVNPRAGQSGVPASTTIDAVLVDASLQVVTSSVQLTLNGQPIQATVSKPANSRNTTISYDPPGSLPGLSTNQARLVYRDSANPAHETTVDWTFVVAESLTPDPPRGQDATTGLLVLEAEHADQNVAAGGTSWVSQTDNPDYSGGAAMAALPNSGRNVNIDVSASPHLDFKVSFTRTGVHYVWLRGFGDGPPGPSANDSVNVGLDGSLPATSDRMGNGWIADNGVSWGNTTFEDPPARFDVATLGEHVINLWMREDGFIFDKLLITPDPAYVPEGAGPNESPRLPPTTEPATLTWRRTAGGVEVAWSGAGILQSSPAVLGPWTTVPNATSPYSIDPTQPAAFFRVTR